MPKPPKFSVLVALGALVAGLGAAWYVGRPLPETTPPKAELPPVLAPASTPLPPSTPSFRATPVTPTPLPEEPTARTNFPAPFAESELLPPPLPKQVELVVMGGSRQVAEVLAKPISEPEKARQLLERLPAMPEEEMRRAAQEAIRRVPNNQYMQLAFPVITSPATHGQVESALVADLAERPAEIALPTTLEIARQPEHPYAKPMQEVLALKLGQDYGSDWARWEAAVTQKLKFRGADPAAPEVPQ